MAFPAAISLTVGGTTQCLFGDCSSVGVLAPAQSVHDFADYTPFTVNGDSFVLYAPFFAANNVLNGTTVAYEPFVIHTGHSSTQQNDAFEIDFFQNFAYSASLNGKYSEATDSYVYLAGPGSSFTAQAFYGGQGLGLMGPFIGLNGSDSHEAVLSDLSGTPLTFEYQMIYDFTAGSEPDALMVALGPIPLPLGTLPPPIATIFAIPEPESFAQLGAGLILFSGITRRWTLFGK
jgi:hypothetical protein